MKITGKHLTAATFVFTLATSAQAHPGHDGHELTWSFHAHGLWVSPLILLIGALLASALVFRVVSKRKSGE
jgi:H+/Cl- antiporter ClcA